MLSRYMPTADHDDRELKKGSVAFLRSEKRRELGPLDWSLSELAKDAVHRRQGENGRRSYFDPDGTSASCVVDEQSRRTSGGTVRPRACRAREVVVGRERSAVAVSDLKVGFVHRFTPDRR